jgi:hypothetical protein
VKSLCCSELKRTSSSGISGGEERIGVKNSTLIARMADQLEQESLTHSAVGVHDDRSSPVVLF